MRNFLVHLFILLVSPVSSQKWDWAVSPSMNEGYRLTLDKKGNVCVIAYGKGPYGTYDLQSPDINSALAKHTHDGTLIWAVGMKSANPLGVSCDGEGNIYVTGSFHGTATLYGINNSTMITGQSFIDAFIAKYSPAGDVQWVSTWDDAKVDDWGRAIRTDENGNSYITGMSVYEPEHGPSRYNCFTMKFDNQGLLLWKKDTQWKKFVCPSGIDIDNRGNCIISGYFSDTAFFENVALTSSQFLSVFVTKYSSDGTLIWCKKQGSNGDLCFGIAVSDQKEIFLTGTYNSPSVFDQVTVSANIVRNTQKEMFVAKLDSNGTAVWVNSIDSAGGVDIACDSQGSCFVTGVFERGATFQGPNPATIVGHKTSGFFVAKYDEHGLFKWTVTTSGDSCARENSVAAVESDNAGNVFVTGKISCNTSFGSSSFNIPYDQAGWYDLFLAKIKDTLYVPTDLVVAGTMPSIKVYPVPAGDIVYIECVSPGNDAKIQLKNIFGECILEKNIIPENNFYKATLNLGTLPNGIYFISVSSDNGVVLQKIVIE